MTSETLLTESYSLSPLQKGMLFHHLEAPHSGEYIQQVVLTLPESVHVPLLREAWQRVLDQHSALRMSFHFQTTAPPLQRVHSHVSLLWQEHDWSNLPAEQLEGELSALLTLERERGFDMSGPPLMRLTLLRLDDDDFRLVWTFHHILADGRARLLLLQEVFSRYHALKSGNSLEFPDPRPYSDYLSWIEEQDFELAEPFWKKRLEGYRGTPPLNLGCRRSASSSRSRRNVQEVRLSPAATASLKDFAALKQLTLNSLVQAAWAFLLSRYSGESDIVFGATRACRKSTVAGSESMIGLLINTVPVRLTIGAHDSVLDCLNAIRTQWIALREVEHTPLSLIHGWSSVPADQPLFETIVVFEHSHLATQLKGLGDEWSSRFVDVYQQTHYPLTLEAYGEDSLLLRIDYAQARFDDATVQRMLGHLMNLLQAMVARPAAHPAELELLTTEEECELLVERNQPIGMPGQSRIPLDGSSTLHQIFEEQAKRTPHAESVSSSGVSLTYEELNTRANQLANQLRELGVGPDVVVGLFLDRSIDMVTGLLAILKAGGAYLPIDLSYPPERIAFMLEDAKASVLLTQTRLSMTLPECQSRVVCIDERTVMPSPSTSADRKDSPLGLSTPVNPQPALAGPDNLAYVIYTSGSTGTPKGVMVTHRNVLRLFSATAHWFEFTERDVWSLFHSYAFDFSVWEIWGALLHGGKLVVVPYLVSRSPELFYQLLEDEQVTVLNQTPSAFRQLIQAEDTTPRKDLALRCVILGGEALETQSLKPWFDRHGDQCPRLINMYGITETTVHVTYRPLSKDDLGAGSVIGEPIPDLQLYILDKRMQPVPLGVPGEIYVGGAGLARGYLNRPELSAERFVVSRFGSEGRLYKTGDLARFLPGREIEYLGRIDQQVKIRGFRIELGEIEAVLSVQPGVREAVVVASDDDTPGIKRLVAYVVASHPGIDTSQLRNSLQKQLPDYMVPAAFVVLDALPLTSNGKVDRKALPPPDHQREDSSKQYVPPETTTEKELAAIWSEVLRVDPVGRHDNFFELGGDSILSIQIIARARQAGFALTPKMLFQNQSIAALAGVVGAARETPRTADSEQGLVPLTPIQHWFFEQELVDQHHYNQAFLLAVAEPLQESAFRQALEVVKQHHGSLRLRFRKKGQRWEQAYGDGGGTLCFERVDLAGMPYPTQASSIQAMAAGYQSSLRIDEGPLSRVIYFDLGHNSTGRLLFVLHHLIVDGVSWRVLLEDLETAYGQLLQGNAVDLPAKTASFGSWAERLVEYPKSSDTLTQLHYWLQVSGGEAVNLPTEYSQGENTEGSTQTVTVELSGEETQTLLQQVPSTFNTQINDVLITALVKSLLGWTGGDELFFCLEGHGREELEEGVDVTRTTGWFTSLFPVRLKIDEALVQDRMDKQAWQPEALLRHIKNHMRRVPLHGLSYSVLRYLLPRSPLAKQKEPEILFNYLGQLDSMVASSKLLAFAPELSGSTHSPSQTRRYLLEINSAVIHGRLKVHWTFSTNRHRTETISRLAREFVGALRCILSSCRSTHRAPAPISGAVPTHTEEFHRRAAAAIEDVYPLSPMQTLFFALASVRPEAVVDQWHCTLDGELDVPAFQQAWAEAIHRYPILRSSFDDEASSQALQRVHREIRPDWTLEDWRSGLMADQSVRWTRLLAEDSKQGFVLAKPPLMRFTLRRVGNTSHKFLWSLPSLLVDGWSWPLVFKCVAAAYEGLLQQRALNIHPVRPFRDYIDWLQNLDWRETEAFWRESLDGFTQPTSLGTAGQTQPQPLPNASETLSFNLDAEQARALAAIARTEQVTLSTLIQASWAMLLGRRSGRNDVVFGVACSGRSATLPGVEAIVGPFVNNLPVRVLLDGTSSLRNLLQTIHSHSLELSQHQSASLQQIQGWSQVSWRSRLFESLVVVQNYQVDDSVFKLGETARIQDFVGPIHSTFDLTVVVTPRETLNIDLVFNRYRIDGGLAKSFAKDFEKLLLRLTASLEMRLNDLQLGLSTPVLTAQPEKSAKLRYGRELPKTEWERRIAGVCQEVLGLDSLGVADNLLEGGAHSLAIVRLHLRLQATLGIDFPIVKVFQYTSVRSLAQYLTGTSDENAALAHITNRARQGREALSHIHDAREACR